jgi:hypothetical protein
MIHYEGRDIEAHQGIFGGWGGKMGARDDKVRRVEDADVTRGVGTGIPSLGKITVVGSLHCSVQWITQGKFSKFV